MAKQTDIVQLIEQRVVRGDYLLNPFPADAQLAEEANASRITVRRAIQSLVDKGFLVRENGRVSVGPVTTAVRQVALLLPTFPSPNLDLWHRMIENQVTARGWNLRLIGYSHWEDQIINSTIQGFDAIFFAPLSEIPPKSFYQRFADSPKPIVVIEEDVSEYGVPCLWLASPELAINKMMEYLVELGHKKIVCLNTQPYCRTIMRRLHQWELWTAVSDIDGDVMDYAVKSYESSVDKAYQVVCDMIVSDDLKATAVVCTTGAAAIGAMRALVKHNIWPGRDISISALDYEGNLAKYMNPPLCCIQNLEPDKYVNVCLDWMAKDNQPWRGALLVEPVTVALFEGESTCRCEIAVNC